MSNKGTPLLRVFLVNVLLLGFLCEVFIVVSLYTPGLVCNYPRGLAQFIRSLYWGYTVPIVQLSKACSKFDPGLSYTLRPGSCQVSSAEYSQEIEINAEGFRDDAQSLLAPEVVFLGDSTTFGWGVSSQEAFPGMFERIAGKLALNAGVPSYGTVRELALLERIDSSRLRWLFLQYDPNDAQENFALGGRRRASTGSGAPGPTGNMSEEYYDKNVTQYRRSRYYFPGKYFGATLVLLVKNLFPAESATRERDLFAEAEVFLRILSDSTKSAPSDLQIVVFSTALGGIDPGGKQFLAYIRELIASRGYSQAVENLTLVNTGEIFGEDDYYCIDGHLNPAGHRKLATSLMDVYRSNDKPRQR